MASPIQSVRGMHDILPAETPRWQQAELRICEVLAAFGYQEICLPLVEASALFARSLGEVTDIVEKEMYTFVDRNGDSLTLRPEGTAGCVRAAIEHGLLHHAQPRLWYRGPMFRHERPQKGRYRQFHQVGVEAFGLAGAALEAELILIAARFWQVLGITGMRLEINSLGDPDTRAVYRDRLIAFYAAHEADLDEDAHRRYRVNPLRVLDSKDPKVRAINVDAPRLLDVLDAESQAHFAHLQALLDAAGLEYAVNPHLVRGLDYYTRTVFEWTTDRLGTQGTVLAGGRYDGLVEQLGGRPTPAAGFALGLERLLALVPEGTASELDAYFIVLDAARLAGALALAQTLRRELPRLRLQVNLDDASLKTQLKRADRLGAQVALILGEAEAKAESITLKFLREDRPQEQVLQTELKARLSHVLDR